MNKMNQIMDNKNRDENRDIKISDTNKILQKYRNSALTYDLIRKIVYDMNESTKASKMDNNDIIMIYE